MKKQLDYLLAKGLIKPSQSPFGAAILFAPKKDGSLRMCIDYRMLNKQTVKTAYPLPHTEAHLDRLVGNRCFSKLDLRSGYWQLRVKKEHQYKTAFNSRYGQFEWQVMPFGLTGAPGYFSSMINQVLGPLLDVCVVAFIDDLLVYSKNEEQHAKDLAQVLGFWGVCQ